MITVTEHAASQISKLIENQYPDATGLRVGVKGGGCSGLSYNLTFESQTRTGDKVFERRLDR